MNRTGEFFSRAYDTRVSIENFMNPDVHTNSERENMGFVYHRLRDFAEKKGYKSNFDIGAFSSGFLERGEVAAVITFPSNDTLFFKNKDFSGYVKDMADDYDISSESARLYTMMHEFLHLFGIDGYAEDEAELEGIIDEFS